jgi:membrane-bound metal-dependent hydrolase YbcI (DUF457 family)
VREGAAGNPLYFLLGGVFGLLPDTIDFKFIRFLHRHQIEVVPDPLRPDPEMIARALAHAAHMAVESGTPVDIKLNTIRLAADRWRAYEVRFDVAGRRVVVAIGPEVDTSGTPLPGADGGERTGATASAPLACGVKPDYFATTTVAAFEGPLFRMTPLADNRVTPVFIPWHRRWTHSLVGALVAGLAVAAWRPLAGAVVLAASAAHAVLDQAGFMGGSLLYPFLRARFQGLRMVRSGDALPNLAAVWLSCVAVFWNLYCGMPGRADPMLLPKLLFYAVALPGGVLALCRARGLFGPAAGRTAGS